MFERVGRFLWGTLLWLPFLVFAFGPAVFLLVGSLQAEDGGWSLEAYRQAWSQGSRLVLLWNSLCVGGGVVGVTVVVGAPLGFLIARTDLRGAGLYRALIVLPLLIPPYVAGIAWTELIHFGGYWAIVLLLAATTLPIVVLLSARGFAEVDGDGEDAARLSLGEGRALREVTLPLARPALVAASMLVFVFAIMDFIVADFFSFATASNFQVFAMDVYAKWATLREPREALAAAVPMLGLGAVGMLVLARWEGRRSHASRRGESRPPRPYRLGRWQPIAHLYLLVVLSLCAFIPLGVLGTWVWESAGSQAVLPTADAPGGWVQVTQEPVTVLSVLRGPALGDLLRTLGYCGLAALGILLVSLGPARSLRRRGGSWGLAAVLVPLAFPSLFVGIGMIQIFNREGFSISLGSVQIIVLREFFDHVYHGGSLVVITLVGRYAPLGVLAIRAAWNRLDPGMEEAARLSIARGSTRLWRVTLPLLAGGLGAAFVLSLCLALRDLDSIVLLDGAQKTLPMRLYNKIHYARDGEVAVLSLLQIGLILLPWTVWRLIAPAGPRKG